MGIKERLHALEWGMKSVLNDDTRYAVAEKIRDLGYIDFRDLPGRSLPWRMSKPSKSRWDCAEPPCQHMTGQSPDA